MTAATSDAGDFSRRLGLGAMPPSMLVLLGILSVQIGAGFAKNLFGVVPPTVIVVLRMLAAAAAVGFIARKALWTLWRDHTRSDLLVAAGLGLTLALMNYSIYQSIQHIPLGIAVTIEFLGPLMVSVLGSRRAIDFLWAALALGGVALLAVGTGDLNMTGVIWALVAGVGWGLYILASAATGERIPGTAGLAVASVIATFTVLPLGIAALADGGGLGILTPKVLLIGLAVGLLSSAIPYTLELEALRRIPQQVFGILMSLEPAVAALVGMVLLQEMLTLLQWLAVFSVIGACLGATRSART